MEIVVMIVLIKCQRLSFPNYNPCLDPPALAMYSTLKLEAGLKNIHPVIPPPSNSYDLKSVPFKVLAAIFNSSMIHASNLVSLLPKSLKPLFLKILEYGPVAYHVIHDIMNARGYFG